MTRMNKLRRHEILAKLATLETHRGGDNICALTIFSGDQVKAWSRSDFYHPVPLPHSMTEIIMNSTHIDSELYFVLVDIVEIDCITAVRICLDG